MGSNLFKVYELDVALTVGVLPGKTQHNAFSFLPRNVEIIKYFLAKIIGRGEKTHIFEYFGGTFGSEIAYLGICRFIGAVRDKYAFDSVCDC
jgi:hypothetical protein